MTDSELVDRRYWEWVPPEGWPKPPQGWQPPFGWHPDPRWPDPKLHVFWRRTRAGRRRRVLIVLACAVPIVLFGGILVVVAIGGECAFDPPPGDQADITLMNDSSSQVIFADCQNASCTKRYDRSDLVRPGRSYTQVHEACTIEQVGVLDDHGTLLGCLLLLPADDPPKVTRFRASQRAACR